MDTIKITSILAKNSIDFIKHVFSLYESRVLFAIDRTGSSLEDFQSLDVQNQIIVNNDHGWLSIGHELIDSEQAAQIVFTSGTEGKAKAILLSYTNLSNVTRRLNTIMHLDSTIREYIGVPVHYSFGLGRCRAVAAAGGAFYIPPNGFNPLEIRNMLRRKEINAISAVPSLWRILLQSVDTLEGLGKYVRWIEIGSQYMSGDEKLRMKQLFPEAKIVQHYGLTEASRSTFLDISSTEGPLLESVGTITDGVSLKIGERGNICIKGEHVAIGQLSETGAFLPLTNINKWLETKDLGEIREGHLWFKGRSDDQVNIGGIKISPERLEQEVESHFHCPNQIVVAGITDQLSGMKLLLAYRFEMAEKISEIKQYIQLALQKKGVQAGSLALFPLDNFPVTDTGKIQRKKLAALYETQSSLLSSAGNIDRIALSDDESALAELWREVLGPQCAIRPDDSFTDLGGDSLSTLQVIIKMEKKGYSHEAIQAMMHGRPLLVVADHSSETHQIDNANGGSAELSKDTVLTWSLSALRGLMVGVVVLAHWGPGLWSRLFGDYESTVNTFLSPIYRMGTPGFAIVFGIGVGYYFIFNKSSGHTPEFGRRIKPILLLVLSAWLLLSGLRLVEKILDGEVVTELLLANSLYNVLCYYVLAIASIPVWRHWLNKVQRNIVHVSIAASFLAWFFHLLAISLISSAQLDNFFELPRLMLTAKYSYFRMSTAVFMGVALGYWLRQNQSIKEISHKLTLLGLGFFFSGFATTLEFLSWQQITELSIVPLSMVFIYLGIASMLLGGVVHLIHKKKATPSFAATLVNFFIVLGVLALPIYIFHGAVLPVKGILVHLGLTKTIALAVPMSCFLIILFWGWLKIYKIYR